MPKYVIIGNSAGAIGAAEAIRQEDETGSLMMVSDEGYPAYSRPLISEFLSGEKSLNQVLYRPQCFYKEMGIEALLGRRVMGIDPEGRYVCLEDNEEIAFEKLLLATGGKPLVPRIDSLDKEGVFTFTTLKDAQAIKRMLDVGAKRAVVVGGGLIGMSAAEALLKRGVEVTIVELMDRLLGTILDTQASLLVERAVAEVGVKVITGHTVEEITGRQNDGKAAGSVILDSGESIHCDLVVVAIGVRPRTELAQGCGIKVNRGIIVDRYMRTSVPGIYACGDVAEAYDFIHESDRVIPIWPNAYIGGRTAGLNMAGLATVYPGGTTMNALKYFGLSVVSAGLVDPTDVECEVLTRAEPENGLYKKIVLRDDLIVGMIYVGDIEKSGIVYGLMRDRINVGELKQDILSEDFGFISFPSDLRKRRLENHGINTGLTPTTGLTRD